MYEFINLTCLCALGAGTVVLRRSQHRPLWVFLLVPVLILLTVSGRWLYANAAPVMPALQSYWLPIHVSVVSLGSGVFLVAGVASILFLLKMSRLSDADAPACWRASCGGCPTRRRWTVSPTAPRSSPSPCSASV
ncbi:cytochrome C assembly family protein [Mycobacterium xenopi 3993]|nr:cytochrome C assembly family protein [Mycobacterium xenopi 3993]